MKKKIVIVDDEPLIAMLITELLEEDEDLELSATATSKKDFFNLINQSTFDIALIDMSIGEREAGLDIVRTLKEKNVLFPSIILSAHDESTYALKALQAGARGYLNKNLIYTDLASCIKVVLENHLFISGDMGSYLIEEYQKEKDKGC